jgi:hypothetical protein
MARSVVTGVIESSNIWQVKVNVKVNLALYRPGDPRISRQSAGNYGKVVIPKHRPPLRPRKYPWYSFRLEAESTLGPECDRKG